MHVGTKQKSFLSIKNFKKENLSELEFFLPIYPLLKIRVGNKHRYF